MMHRLHIIRKVFLVGVLPHAACLCADHIPQFDGQVHTSGWVGSVVLDGKLDEPEWEQTEAIETIAGEHGTVLRFLHDKQKLYVGVAATSKDTKRLTVKYRQDGGKVWRDDAFELFIDPRHTHETYHQICINAGGFACILKAGERKWWAPQMDIKTSAEPHCWFIEAALPWKTIGGSHATGKTIAIAAARNIVESVAGKYVPWGNPRKRDQNPHLILVNPDSTQQFNRYFTKLTRRRERKTKELAAKARGLALDEATQKELSEVRAGVKLAAAQVEPRLGDLPGLGEREKRLLAALQAAERLAGIIRFIPFFQ